MSGIRKAFRRSQRESKKRRGQLSPREVDADAVREILKGIKDTVKGCKELHSKWEDDEKFKKVNSDYLAKANKLIGHVDNFREKLELTWPKSESKEISDLKASVNKLARERDDAEYRLEEAEIEISNLKKRLGEQPLSDRGRRGRQQQQQENMSKRPAAQANEHEQVSHVSKRAKQDGSLDRKAPSRTPVYRNESSSSSKGTRRDSRNYDTLEREIQELSTQIANLKEENKSLSDNSVGTMKALKDAKGEVERYKKQMEGSDATLARSQQELEHMKNENRSLKKIKEEVEQSLNQLKARDGNFQSNVDRIQRDLTKERQAKEEALNSLRHSKSNEENLRDTIDRLQRNVSAEREAKDEALIRLSAVAGNKLRDNNPAITDLSDPNRPMKLAEKVSELYDNEWTNAMENLENDMEEQEAIKVLLNIVANVFGTCAESGDAQTDFISSLQLPIAVPDIDNLRNIAKASLLTPDKLTELTTEITKPLKDYRKGKCELVSPLLCNVIKARLKQTMTEKTIQACDEFINATVKYVWMMRVQDPPVYMEWKFSRGEKFDHDRLRSYTKGGDSVDYVVWPILYLHKGGPMLAKGVAQGMKTKPNK
ncbi:putative uncharacterized protein MYH16 [Argopecten irradians]|uniref:putative uncharacterized protein MYH16 n=1 Tax=Argopecten irradians TaxID=31199 RepID=UPI00371FE9A3